MSDEIIDRLTRLEDKVDRLISITHPVLIHRDEQTIRSVILDYFNISLVELLSSARFQGNNVIPRHFLCFFTKAILDISIEKIGKILGGKHHTTILHSIGMVCNWLESGDKEMMKHYDSICAILEYKRFDVDKIHDYLLERKIKQNSSLKHIRNA